MNHSNVHLRTIIIFSLLLLLVLPKAIAQNASQRVKYNFNSDWKMFVGNDSMTFSTTYDDSHYKCLTFPHVWNEDEAFKNCIDSLSTGIAWKSCKMTDSTHVALKLGDTQTLKMFGNR